MHNLKTNFDKILNIAKHFFADKNEDGNFQDYRRKPKMSDIEIIALSITSEAISIDSENRLFAILKAEYKTDFQNLIDRSNYNRRRKRLCFMIEKLSKNIAEKISGGEDYFIVDSIPIPVCKIVREKRSKICRESFETSPGKGFSAVSQSYIFGYKLHLVTTINGIYHSMDFTKAGVHDIHYLNDVKNSTLNNCTLIGDKGYLSSQMQIDLFHECQIKLVTPMRKNQKEKTPWQPVFRKNRKRIETLFSQLCDQFHLKTNYAKSFAGLSTRIISKIAAVTCLQYLNVLNNKSLNHLKFALA
jgi:hypothetical protein